MVILQFNKLIRNKWVWGVFAVAISAAFCFDDMFTSRDSSGPVRGDAGMLAGEPVKGENFAALQEDVRGFGPNRSVRKDHEVNRLAWETCAALKVAAENGMDATDGEAIEAIRSEQSFCVNGAFSFELYRRSLLQNGVTPERFEEFLKRRLTMNRIADSVLDAATWVSPAEVDMAVSDYTDSITVRVARFAQTKSEADAVKMDDAGLRKWYDSNTNEIALPARVKLRMIRFDAADPKVLARMTVTDDEMHDHYDATVDRYTSTDTNGVEKVKKFEEVKGQVEKELRQIAAVQYFETNLIGRLYPEKVDPKVSRLDVIAKTDGLKVTTTDWFSTEGGYQEGFMKRIGSIAPGANGLADAVAQLDSESEDSRYGLVSGEKAVWAIELAERSPAHVPTFDEAKDAIRPRALRAAQLDAFKAKVAAVSAKGVDAVLATKGTTTNITFAVCDLQPNSFTDASAVAGAARKLKKGEISEFTQLGQRSALLVVCTDRKPGDSARAVLLKGQIAAQLAMPTRAQIPEAWRKWNLERMGFEPGEGTSVEIPEEVE